MDLEASRQSEEVSTDNCDIINRSFKTEPGDIADEQQFETAWPKCSDCSVEWYSYPLASIAGPQLLKYEYPIINSDLLLIGQGFNSLTGEAGGAAVVFDGEADLATAGGKFSQNMKVRVEQINSTSQLKESLGVSAAASFGWGIFSADASVSTFSSKSISSYSDYLLIDAQIYNPAEILRDARLSPYALSLVNDPERFLQFAGNSFVYGRRTGGRLRVLVEILSASDDEQNSNHIALKASVAAIGSGSLDIASQLNTLNARSDIRIHYQKQGGSNYFPLMGDFLKELYDFPHLAVNGSDHDYCFELFTRSYSSVEMDRTASFNQLPFRQQIEKVLILARLIDDVGDLQTDYKYALANLEQFDVQGNSIQEKTDYVQAQLDLADVAMNRLVNTVRVIKECPSEPLRGSLVRLVKGLPKPFKRKTSTPFIPIVQAPDLTYIDLTKKVLLGRIPYGERWAVEMVGFVVTQPIVNGVPVPNPVPQGTRSVTPTGMFENPIGSETYSPSDPGTSCAVISLYMPGSPDSANPDIGQLLNTINFKITNEQGQLAFGQMNIEMSDVDVYISFKSSKPAVLPTSHPMGARLVPIARQI